MRTSSLAKPAVILLWVVCGCARKGDPVPAPPVPPKPPGASWISLRQLEVKLPSQDAKGAPLRGLEAIRILYLPMGLARPTNQDVFAHGEIVLERQRPGLPGPGEALKVDLKNLKRPAGWIVVVAVRAGEAASAPSQVLAWMDPAL
ncbi:MAG: hypothetical protein KGI56_09475 [Acidobacteriota bacterium]|nr:hypothetical protein [Acidobacteriota bacterium]